MTVPSSLSFLSYSQLTDATDSDVSTQDTIRQMYALVHQYQNSEQVEQALTQALTGTSPTSSARIKISKVFYWIKQTINFVQDPVNVAKLLPNVPDPNNVELLLAPDMLLTYKSGDCDCFSTLASAMLRRLGLATRFITIASKDNNPLIFSHVYLEVFDPDNQVWLPFDSSHGNKPDWEYKNVTRRYTWTD